MALNLSINSYAVGANKSVRVYYNTFLLPETQIYLEDPNPHFMHLPPNRIIHPIPLLLSQQRNSILQDSTQKTEHIPRSTRERTMREITTIDTTHLHQLVHINAERAMLNNPVPHSAKYTRWPRSGVSRAGGAIAYLPVHISRRLSSIFGSRVDRAENRMTGCLAHR
jgi:hypothetical protein